MTVVVLWWPAPERQDPGRRDERNMRKLCSPRKIDRVHKLYWENIFLKVSFLDINSLAKSGGGQGRRKLGTGKRHCVVIDWRYRRWIKYAIGMQIKLNAQEGGGEWEKE